MAGVDWLTLKNVQFKIQNIQFACLLFDSFITAFIMQRMGSSEWVIKLINHVLNRIRECLPIAPVNVNQSMELMKWLDIKRVLLFQIRVREMNVYQRFSSISSKNLKIFVKTTGSQLQFLLQFEIPEFNRIQEMGAFNRQWCAGSWWNQNPML